MYLLLLLKKEEKNLDQTHLATILAIEKLFVMANQNFKLINFADIWQKIER